MTNKEKQLKRWERKRLSGLTHAHSFNGIEYFSLFLTIINTIRLKFFVDHRSLITLAYIVCRYNNLNAGSSVWNIWTNTEVSGNMSCKRAICYRLKMLHERGLIDLIDHKGINYAYPSQYFLKEVELLSSVGKQS